MISLTTLATGLLISAIMTAGIYGLLGAWLIQRAWLRRLALLAGLVWITLAVYWLIVNLWLSLLDAILTENIHYWIASFIIALFWLCLSFIVDRQDRASKSS